MLTTQASYTPTIKAPRNAASSRQHQLRRIRIARGRTVSHDGMSPCDPFARELQGLISGAFSINGTGAGHSAHRKDHIAILVLRRHLLRELELLRKGPRHKTLRRLEKSFLSTSAAGGRFPFSRSWPGWRAGRRARLGIGQRKIPKLRSETASSIFRSHLHLDFRTIRKSFFLAGDGRIDRHNRDDSERDNGGGK